MSYLTLHPILPYLTLGFTFRMSYLTLQTLPLTFPYVLPHRTLHFTLPYLTLPYLTLPYLTLPDVLPYLTLPYRMSYLILPYLTLPYLTLPYLTLPSFQTKMKEKSLKKTKLFSLY